MFSAFFSAKLCVRTYFIFKACIGLLLDGSKASDYGATPSLASMYSSNSLSLVLAKKASRSLISEKPLEEPFDIILLSSLYKKEVESSNYLGILLLGVYSDYLYPCTISSAGSSPMVWVTPRKISACFWLSFDFREPWILNLLFYRLNTLP